MKEQDQEPRKPKFLQLYPDDLPLRLDYLEIITHIRQYCFGPLGEEQVEQIRCYTDHKRISMRLQQVEEMLEALREDVIVPGEGYLDLSHHLKMLGLENSVLAAEEMLEVMQAARTARTLWTTFGEQAKEFPALSALFNEQPFPREVAAVIGQVLNDEGQVKPGVSPELERIRREIRNREREFDRQFDKIARDAAQSGWLAEGGETVRNGRRVLSVLAEHKRDIRGVIRDESSSGRVVYMEPERTLEVSNEIFDLQQQEKREIYRILRELTNRIRPYRQLLRDYQRILGLIDFVHAKAQFAKQIQAQPVKLVDRPSLHIQNGIHPLLYLHHQKSGKSVVPLNLHMEDGNHILVISGPNAGGKSVLLKTVGLLQMMIQSGIMIPAEEETEMGIFHRLFVDIGDQQSLEKDLSTYTSHLQNMRYFLQKADGHTLFMIDEFGTGTDPQLGGAMAESILKALKKQKAWGVVTTHYGNLKTFADQQEGLVNGAMRFNQETIEPTFELEMGKPGSSFTFKIAERTGLPKRIINEARHRAGIRARSVEEMLNDLEKEKQQFEDRSKRVKEKEQHLESLIGTYTQLKNDLEENRKELLRENKEKALQELKETNRKLEQVVKDLREQDRRTGQPEQQQEAVREARQKIQQERQNLRKDLQELQPKEAPAAPAELEVGQTVKMRGSDQTGRIEEFRKNKALVAFGQLKTLVDRKKLEPVKAQPKQKSSFTKTTFDIAEKAAEYGQTLDVRGHRVDEALNEVEQFLDNALMVSHKELKIIHGKGHGHLRPAIRDFLGRYPEVEKFEGEVEHHGGAGVTLVWLR